MKSDIHYCISTINDGPLLTLKEERDLFSRIGESGVREKLILSNRRLVLYRAKRVWAKNPSASLADLIQEGCNGLIKAVDSYQLDRITWINNLPVSARFATWAYRLIGHSLNEYIILLNGHHVTHRACKIIAEAGGAYVTSQEIDDAVASGKIPYKRAKIAKQAIMSSRSAGGEALEYIADYDKGLTDVDTADDIRCMLETIETFTIREQEIFRMAYHGDMSNNEIGELLDLSGARIQQIRVAALKRLRLKLEPMNT